MKTRAGKTQRLSSEAAGLALERVRERYGIPPCDQHRRGSGCAAPPAPKAKTEQEPSKPIESWPSVIAKSDPPLDLEWEYYPAAPVARNEPNGSPLPKRSPIGKRHESTLPFETQTFHYLIQIAECAVPLHCQVKAETVAEALSRVEQIPNLIHCREISDVELAAYK